MYVPNYIPEPLEVPGNITLRPYRMRVKFIRQVVWLHTLSLLAVTALSFTPGRNLPTRSIGIVLIGALLLLDLLRIQLRGKPLEAQISGVLLPPMLLLAGWSAADLMRHGWPSWAILCGGTAVLLYTIVCGRDFSFVGCFAIAFPLSSAGIVGITQSLHLPALWTFRALFINFVYLSYSVYDLASLLARRREDEQFAAVMDLYRDVFNFIGYFWRCLHHWKKHKIWVVPK